MNTTRRRITHLLTIATTAILLIVGVAAPSGAVPDATDADATAADASDEGTLTEDAASGAALPDDLPEIGEVFDPNTGMSASDFCIFGWCSGVSGGHGQAISELWKEGDYWHRYTAWFLPDDERLVVTDGLTDGYEASADVVVTNRFTGVVIDTDSNLSTGTQRIFQLGTPDGSGNIPEGLAVDVRVCRSDGSVCSPWRTGIS